MLGRLFGHAALAAPAAAVFSVGLVRVAEPTQPRRPSAASRTIRKDFQMAVGFLFLVLHQESETFLKFLFGLPGISGRSSCDNVKGCRR